MSKLADGAPPFCSSCYAQYADKRYVDFEAAYDGPVLNTDNPNVGGAVKAQIDDLVLCEDCIQEAVEILALHSEVKRQLDAALRALDEAEANEAKAVEYATNLEQTLGSKPKQPVAA